MNGLHELSRNFTYVCCEKAPALKDISSEVKRVYRRYFDHDIVIADFIWAKMKFIYLRDLKILGTKIFSFTSFHIPRPIDS